MNTRDIIISKYGEPGAAYQSKFCEIWEVKKEFPWFPANRIFINKDFKIKLQLAFKNLEAKKLHVEIKTFDGCYNDRAARGINVRSLHAWAMAIDINAAQNPLGGKVMFSQPFLQCFRAAGLFCGADWTRKDGMHFALFNG